MTPLPHPHYLIPIRDEKPLTSPNFQRREELEKLTEPRKRV